jgi:uncharacterized protein
MTDWTWDERKSASNLAKHGINFETAQLVFDDPMALTQFDLHSSGEERWQTIGVIGPATIFVAHTAPENGEPGRIISARKATRHERKAYEEGEF